MGKRLISGFMVKKILLISPLNTRRKGSERIGKLWPSSKKRMSYENERSIGLASLRTVTKKVLER
jgi:hypothetical protein